MLEGQGNGGFGVVRAYCVDKNTRNEIEESGVPRTRIVETSAGKMAQWEKSFAGQAQPSGFNPRLSL